MATNDATLQQFAIHNTDAEPTRKGGKGKEGEERGRREGKGEKKGGERKEGGGGRIEGKGREEKVNLPPVRSGYATGDNRRCICFTSDLLTIRKEPALLWRICHFGAGYKTPDLLAYLPY